MASSEEGSEPLVSVIIPAYDRPKLLEKAIASVLAQTYQRWELLIVEDGSPVDLTSTVRMFSDPRIQHLRQKENQGVAAARNRGANVAKGEYIAFLDSDDEWKPQKLARQLSYLRAKGPEFNFSYTLREVVDDTGAVISDYNKHEEEGDLREVIAWPAVLGTPSSWLIRRQLFLEMGGFDESLKYAEDWEFSIRLAKVTMIACLRERLTVMREHSGERLSKGLENKPHVATSLIAIHDRHLEVFEKSPKAHAELLRRISYYLRINGDLRGSRKYAIKALTTRPSIESMKFLAKALIGGG
ncbi:MAG: glycosyltransferase [Methanomassiliicoccales archaeon]